MQTEFNPAISLKKQESLGTELTNFSMCTQIIICTYMKPNNITCNVTYLKSMNIKAADNDAC